MNSKCPTNNIGNPAENEKSTSKKVKLITQRKAQILDAARPIFAKNGYRRTKVDEIAEYLNVGKGTIYRYFSDKKALFLAVFGQGMDELSGAMISNIEQVASPLDKFKVAVNTYFRFFDANRDMIEIMMQVRSEFKAEFQDFFRSMYGYYIVKIEENLHNGVKMGIFREMDVGRTAEAYNAMLRGILHGFYLREFDSESENAETLTDKADAVLGLLLNGILKKDV